jgi:hypothetical protein
VANQSTTNHLRVLEVTSQLIFNQADWLIADAESIDDNDLARFLGFVDRLPQAFLRRYKTTFLDRLVRALIKMKYKLTPRGGFLSRTALLEVASEATSKNASKAEQARLAALLYYEAYPASRLEEIAGWLILNALEQHIRSRASLALSRTLPCDWGIEFRPLSNYRKRQVLADITALRTFVFSDPDGLERLWNASSEAGVPYAFSAWTERLDGAARQR